jgi:hypothetical protein
MAGGGQGSRIMPELSDYCIDKYQVRSQKHKEFKVYCHPFPGFGGKCQASGRSLGLAGHGG